MCHRYFGQNNNPQVTRRRAEVVLHYTCYRISNSFKMYQAAPIVEIVSSSEGDVDFFKRMMQNILPNAAMKTKNYWSQFDSSYECEKCKRKYRHKSTYRRHVTYECGKEPMFRCPFLDCSYKAYQKTHTDAHIKTKHKIMTIDYKG
ncbi:longitudinals lacking isoform 3 [Danaus plexippus plexippus]|uniref:Longitudinals lacking isoform 3 n=1 Tax=Danaus plexippus plexippus TaxID=278856 RepID=A0A212FLZ1_DANPL|nr:longitudinals lacking isoform 3 [Danaus plexippus plexippus]